MVRKIVLSIVAVLSVCTFALAQNLKVSGTVVDSAGAPIVGATVVIDGTNTGVTTNVDGLFTINAPRNGKLVVSSLGYEEKIVDIAGKTTVNVTLAESSQSIDDVVVMGYGSGRKIGTVIGSVDKVGSKELENRPSNNVMDAMQGKVAGLSISTSNGELNTTSTIRIHGMGSLGAGTTPLILLDGAPISAGTLLAMNQNDIESISVLKDASATSIYGSRAANGVIYVASKKGARGSENVDVTLRTSYSMSSMPKRKLTTMDTSTYMGYMDEVVKAMYPNYWAAYGPGTAGGDQMGIVNPGDFYNWLFWDFEIDPTVNTDWYDTIMDKNTPMYQVDLSVSGGSKKTSYYFSGNYSDQTGVMPGSELTRYTFRANVDTRANDWLKMGMNLGIGYTDSEMASTADAAGSLYTSNPLFASLMIPSYQRATNEDGSMMEFLDLYADANPLVNPMYSPMTSNRLQLNGQAFVEIAPVKGLTLRSSLSANAFDYRSHSHMSPKWPTASGPRGTGSTSELFQRSYEWTWTNTAEYQFSIAEKNNFSVLLGQEAIYSNGELMSISMKGLTNDRFMTINQGTEISGLPSYSNSEYAFNSVFGRIEYNYDNRYFIDGLVRNDGSSRFGANNRNATFWAAGAMWKLSNEAFLKDSETLNDLSVKVSYGTQGNSGIGNYSQYEYISSGSPYDGTKTWYLANVGNPNLAWEKQSTLSIAAMVKLWNKLTIEAEYYNRKTDDMLMPIPKAPSAGFSSVTGNVGAMTNSGIDLSVNYDIFQNKDWYVGAHATFNYNKNKLTKLWDPTLEQAVYTDMLYYMKDRAFPTYYTQEWRGVNPETGEGQWTAEDGSITTDFYEAALVDLDKTPYAPYTGGFGVQATWKGLSLIADFSWAAGNYMVNNNLYFIANTDFAMGYNQAEEVLDYWKEPGDRTKYPSLDYAVANGGTQFDSRMVEDASYLRLKNIQISYSLPKDLLNKSGFIKGVKVFVGARNMLTWTDYSGFDPEVSENLFDTDIYPNTRQWTFGAELTF